MFGSGPGIARLPGYVEEPDEAQLVVRCAIRSRYRTEEAVLPRGREIELRLVPLPRLCEDIARPENPLRRRGPSDDRVEHLDELVDRDVFRQPADGDIEMWPDRLIAQRELVRARRYHRIEGSNVEPDRTG